MPLFFITTKYINLYYFSGLYNETHKDQIRKKVTEKRQSSAKGNRLKKFQEEIKDGLDFVCCCCHRLRLKRGIKVLDAMKITSLIEKTPQQVLFIVVQLL